MLDVDRRIHIPVVYSSTGTRPDAILEVQLRVDNPAEATQAARRIPAIDNGQLPLVPQGFVGKHEAEKTMASIGERFAQLGSRESLNVQVFDADGLMLADQPMAELMQKVSALLRNASMHICKAAKSFRSIATAPLFPRYRTLGAPQCAFCPTVKPWCRGPLAGTQNSEIFEACIKSHGRVRMGIWKWSVRQFKGNNKHDIPVSRCISLKCCRFGLTVDGAMLTDSNMTNLWNNDVPISDSYALRDAEGWNVTFLRFVTRIASASFKEVFERLLQVSQSLLQCLTVYVSQPSGLRLLLEIRQLLAQRGKCQACPMLTIVGLLAIQRPVPHKTACTSKLEQLLGLNAGWLHAEAVRALVNQHMHTCSIFEYITRFMALQSSKFTARVIHRSLHLPTTKDPVLNVK